MSANLVPSLPPPPSFESLTINIKSQGQWASFVADPRHATCLLRPGMLGVGVPAHEWGQSALLAHHHAPRPRLLCAGIVPAPVGSYGVMFIDYDARQAVAIQNTGTSSFRVENNTPGTGVNGTPESEWLLDMLSAGHLPTVHASVPDNEGILHHQEVRLPSPPPHLRTASGLRNIAEWMIQEGSKGLGVDPPIHWNVPLRAPGWAFFQAWPNSPPAAQFLAELAWVLHPREAGAWAVWSDLNDYHILGSTARLAVRLAALNQGLSGPCPEQEPGSPARPRM